MTASENLPKVEKGIPIPRIKLRDQRHVVRRPCKWRTFLLGLEPGDSFVVEWPECATVRAWARKLGVTLVWAALAERGPHCRPQERYWRIERDQLGKYERT